jgi:hypothetical protein
VLTISRFHAAYHVPHGTPDPDLLRARLDHTVRERLPVAIASEAGQTAGNAYYVIRRLHLNLWVDAMAMEEGAVADQWGKLVARAVVRAILYGSSDNVRRYEDTADYLAAFLGDVADGRAWTCWEYEQLRPLEGLTTSAVVSHVLAARPELLVRTAERLAGSGHLMRLLEALDERDAELIWRDGLGFGDVSGYELPEDINALLAAAPSMRSAGSGAAAFARFRLAAYLQLSVAQRRHEPDVTVAAVSHGLARLQQLMTANPAPPIWQALANGEIESPDAISGFLAGLGDGVAAARQWIIEQLSSPGGASKVAPLVRVLRPAMRGIDEASPGPGPRLETVSSAFAGMALLAPALREMGVFEIGGRDAVFQVLIDATGADHAPVAANEPGLRVLAGIEPLDARRARGADVSWPDMALPAPADDESTAGYLPVTLAAFRRVAQRLRGFESSSPEYLGRQFLRLPGHLELGPESLTVTLHQAPLGMVLQMSGLTGAQGPVPWLDGRELVIELSQGGA